MSGFEEAFSQFSEELGEMFGKDAPKGKKQVGRKALLEEAACRVEGERNYGGELYELSDKKIAALLRKLKAQ